MNKIVWLASYPKSGNTWIRVFLSNLLTGSPEGVNINELYQMPTAHGRDTFDSVTGLISSELTLEEIQRLRQAVYNHLSDTAQQPIYFKIHDAYETDLPGPVPAYATKVALYIVRNPLDVATSWAHHDARPIDGAIDFLADAGATIAPNPSDAQLPQRLGTWSQHAAGWMDAPLPCHVVRYEDLQSDPMASFRGIAHAVGLDPSDDELARAIENSRFSALKKQEQAHGFVERSVVSGTFFRSGKTGTWQDELTTAQIDRVVEAHGPVMARLGYLDDAGRPVPA